MGIKSLVKDKKGFTIIEVVLVLAIAGLIFLMVFLAWPALQRGQKDTQRKEDMARFLTALNNYQSNNNGKIPGDNDWNDKFIPGYLTINNETFEDPDMGPYKVENHTGSLSGEATQTEFDGKIHLYHKARCDGEKAVSANTGTRKIAILYKLEGSGTYCGNN